MKAAVIAAPRRLALIGAASFLVPLSLVVLAYGAIERRVSIVLPVVSRNCLCHWSSRRVT
jgi:hypothetical protein